MKLEYDRNKAIEMLSAELTCINRQMSPDHHCIDCDRCILTYNKGTMKDKSDLIKVLLNTLVD